MENTKGEFPLGQKVHLIFFAYIDHAAPSVSAARSAAGVSLIWALLDNPLGSLWLAVAAQTHQVVAIASAQLGKSSIV